MSKTCRTWAWFSSLRSSLRFSAHSIASRAMANILDSEAAFQAKAADHGLAEQHILRLKASGVTTLNGLAFSVTTPGTAPGEQALKELISPDPDVVTVGQLSSIRRLMFDAQTLCAAQVRAALAGGDTSKKGDLVPAERNKRIQDQKARLLGMVLTGPLEVAHSAYDLVTRMVEQDAPHYLEPHRFVTRASEVAKEKPGKEIVLDNVNLTLRDSERKDRCAISNELQLQQALTRRSLACDLVGVCAFATMERWHRFLMDTLQHPVPPQCKAVSIEQILRADRQAWVVMAETLTTLRKTPAGTMPLDTALDKLRTDPTVVFHMLPLPDKSSGKSDKVPPASPGKGASPKKPTRKPWVKQHGNKGKGKGKGKGKVPTELIGLHQQTSTGKRICYNFNLSRGCSFAEANQSCMKGLHVCMRCFEGHSAQQCPQKSSWLPEEPSPFSSPSLAPFCRIKRPISLDTSFSTALTMRVKGHSLSDLLCVEIFSGTGGLTAQLHRYMPHSLGIDSFISQRVKAPILKLDLTTDHGQQLLWRILANDRVVFVHAGPPCEPSRRAQKISTSHGRKPLRSSRYPDGLPHLCGASLKRVTSANQLYKLVADVFLYASRHGIIATVENPARSHFWNTSYFKGTLGTHAASWESIFFHHCCFESPRKKHTRLLVNCSGFQPLAQLCPGDHEHEPWGKSGRKWSASCEVEYPTPLCRAWARCVVDVLVVHGAMAPAVDLSTMNLSLNAASQTVVGKQPRGTKLRPLMAEYAAILYVTAPVDRITSFPVKVDHPLVLRDPIRANPAWQHLPVGSKRLCDPYPLGGSADTKDPVDTNDVQSLWAVKYGVPWSPEQFMREAAGKSHPSLFVEGVHPLLKKTLEVIGGSSVSKLARERTETMRKWMLRSQELRDLKVDGKECSPEHAKKILKNKNLCLFGEMLKSSGLEDQRLAKDISRGFDLMGEIPSGGSFPLKPTFPSLTPEQVRQVAMFARASTWQNAKRTTKDGMAEDLYKITLDERDKGWLEGPFSLEQLPATSVLTKRFGVRQSSTLSDGTRVFKTRPIDDYTESLVNLTNGCSESILPMGIDMICAGLVTRYRLKGPEDLVAKTIDLRKAYKNLPLSSEALNDSFICVFNPTRREPEAFKSLVLPFGARAAVLGFCRTSLALWAIGTALFRLHWSIYFDDFFLVSSEAEMRHVDLTQSVLFELLGWETSEEKEAGFGTLARILGVKIDLSGSRLGTFSVMNVEGRVKDLTKCIDEMIQKGNVSVAEIRILRGRLVFAESQVYGRLAGAHMRQLSKFEGAVGRTALDSDTVESLKFLRDRVLCGAPRSIVAPPGRVFHLYTDASLESGIGGLGGVLLGGEGQILSFFSCVVPEDLVRLVNPLSKKTVIYELEALAISIGLNYLLDPIAVQRNDKLVGFVDNNAVLAQVISGRGVDGVAGRIFSSIFAWEADAGINTWWERVASASNIADFPSRGDVTMFDARLEVRVHVKSFLEGLLWKEGCMFMCFGQCGQGEVLTNAFSHVKKSSGRAFEFEQWKTNLKVRSFYRRYNTLSLIVFQSNCELMAVQNSHKRVVLAPAAKFSFSWPSDRPLLPPAGLWCAIHSPRFSFSPLSWTMTLKTMPNARLFGTTAIEFVTFAMPPSFLAAASGFWCIWIRCHTQFREYGPS